MKKKQMLAMLVMLSLLQTTAYADYLKPALTQGDKFDGLVWWHDGELYAKNEDGVVQKLEIVTDTDGHRVATANIKGDVTGTALDYSFGWQSIVLPMNLCLSLAAMWMLVIQTKITGKVSAATVLWSAPILLI